MPQPADPFRPNPQKRGQRVMKNQLNALLLTAALSGLVGGTTVAAHASTQGPATAHSAKVLKAGLRNSGSNADSAKHSCKGKNDCKGQGGCKGKNSCKGKGGCATDGSKMPDAI